MKVQHWLAVIICLLLSQNALIGQTKTNTKFGKITLQDFDLSGYDFDTSASAVIIVDIGDSYYKVIRCPDAIKN